MLGSSQNSAAFAKKTMDPHLLKKSMKDLTIGVVFVCGGSGWDGWNYEARKGIPIHTCCFNKRRIYSDKWRKDFRVPSRVSFCVCVLLGVFAISLPRFQRANFRKIHCDVFFSMDFFWLKKYRTLKYSQPLQNTLLLRLTQSNTRQN